MGLAKCSIVCFSWLILIQTLLVITLEIIIIKLKQRMEIKLILMAITLIHLKF